MNSRSTFTADRLGAALAPDFRLLRLLGEGAMARVYLAREVALERLVAVKVLRPELAEDDTASRRFQREARSAARITHPGVTTVHRVGTLEDGTPYIVMEYVEGRTLADLLAAEGPMAPERAREVLAQVASALAAAHEKGVVHRDVRPGNVLVEKDTGRVVLSDFGIAAGMESGSASPTRLTPLGEVLGNPRYLSPEQLLGEPVTEGADVYSLGVVGYEMLTGRGPYPGETHGQLVTGHLQLPPLPLRSLRPDAPEELAGLLERCLAKKPEHRPRAADLARALSEEGYPEAVTVHGREVAPPLFPTLAAFLAELQRRRVYRTAAAYTVGMFVVLEGADIIFSVLPVPEWTLTALVVGALAGFPLVLVLTWIFDVTRGGIRRTEDLQGAGAVAASRPLRIVLQLAGLGVSVLLAGVVGWWALR